MVSTDLPKFELSVYWVVWLSSLFYAIYCFACDGSKRFQNSPDRYGDFSPGWAILDRRKDSSNNEWESAKKFIPELCSFVIVSTAISELLRTYKQPSLLKYWQIFVSTCAIIVVLGWQALGFLLIQPLLFRVALWWDSKWGIWLCNVTSLALLNVFKGSIYAEEYLVLFGFKERQAYMMAITAFWTNMRCTEYSLQILSSEEKPELLNQLSYCLYLPPLMFGPIIPYEDFKKNYNEPAKSLTERLLRLLIKLLRFTFWFWFLELTFHYVYVNVADFYPRWVNSLGRWSLYGFGFAMGQCFHIKYLVLYGLSTAFAEFESMDIPFLPICTARVHLCSDMWRYFDNGLHRFILKRIFIPTMRQRRIINHMFSSFLCFLFIYIWHGTYFNVFIWTALNYLGVTIENISKEIYAQYLKDTKLVRFLGPIWVRRLTCVCLTPMFVMSSISNFYFLARQQVGHTFVKKIFTADLTDNLLLFTVLYCCCQIGTELKNKLYRKKTA